MTPLPFQAREYLLLLPPFGVETAQGLPGLGRGPRQEGPNTLAAAALVVEPRLAAWRDALGDWAGSEPVLAGSGSTWFIEGGGAARDGGAG